MGKRISKGPCGGALLAPYEPNLAGEKEKQKHTFFRGREGSPSSMKGSMEGCVGNFQIKRRDGGILGLNPKRGGCVCV